MTITATLVVRRQFVRAAAVHFYAANMQYSRSVEMAQVVRFFRTNFIQPRQLPVVAQAATPPIRRLPQMITTAQVWRDYW
jgi:hypothetical protein